MKRCDFCVHKNCTQRGENVCEKRLIYLDEIKHDFPCEDLELNFNVVPVVITAIVSVVILVVSLLYIFC